MNDASHTGGGIMVRLFKKYPKKIPSIENHIALMPGSSVWVFVTVDAGWRIVSVTLHAVLDLEVESRHHV